LKVADRIRRKCTTIGVMALSLLLCSAAFPDSWNQARSAGFGTVQWQRNIFRAQNARAEGRSREADIYLQQALTDAKQLGKHHPFYTITLRHLSDAAVLKYQFKEARDFSIKELELLKPLGDDYQDLVPIYLRLADIALAEGNLEEASHSLDKAKALKEQAMFNPTFKAEISLRRAMVALAKNDPGEFRSLTKSGIDEWIKMVKEPKAGTNLSEYAIEVARLSLHADKKLSKTLREAALEFSTRALSLIKNYQGSEGLGYIQCLQHLGEIYRMHKRPLDEIACYQRGAEACIATKLLNFKDKSVVLFQYGKPLVDQKYYAEALPMLRQSEVYSKKVNSKNFRIDILFHLSACLAGLNQAEESITFKRELVDILESKGRRLEAQQQLREIDALSARIK